LVWRFLIADRGLDGCPVLANHTVVKRSGCADFLRAGEGRESQADRRFLVVDVVSFSVAAFLCIRERIQF